MFKGGKRGDLLKPSQNSIREQANRESQRRSSPRRGERKKRKYLPAGRGRQHQRGKEKSARKVHQRKKEREIGTIEEKDHEENRRLKRGVTRQYAQEGKNLRQL